MGPAEYQRLRRGESNVKETKEVSALCKNISCSTYFVLSNVKIDQTAPPTEVDSDRRLTT